MFVEYGVQIVVIRTCRNRGTVKVYSNGFNFCHTFRSRISRVNVGSVRTGLRQPGTQGLLGIQNGGSEKTLANSRPRVHKFANHKARCRFETIKISNIFGDTRPAVCQGLLRTAILRRPWGRGWWKALLKDESLSSGS